MTRIPNQHVSVVVLTKNSARTIKQCLESVVKERPNEILVVDGMSTDATLAYVSRYPVKVVTDASCSLGRSRQLGVNSASGTYVMFVDSDVELTSGCVKKLVDELEERGWAGILAKLVSKENLSYWQRSSHWQNEANPHSEIGQQDYIVTAATLFRRDLLSRYQFDPDFIEAAEDIDVSWRLTRDGYVVGISTAVTVYHTYRREFFAFFRYLIRYGRGYARLMHKYRSPRMVLAPLHFATTQLERSVVTGRFYRTPYWACLLAGVTVGIVTFRPHLTCARDLRKALRNPRPFASRN